MIKPRRASLLALVGSLTLAPTALAQAPAASSKVAVASEPPLVAGVSSDKATDAQKKEAIGLFQAGQLSFSLEKWADAQANFRKSYAIIASPNSRMMFARSLARAGKVLDAHRESLATLEEATAAAAANPKYQGTVQGAKDDLAELEKKLALVVLVLPEGVTDGKLTVNKKALDPAAWSKPLVLGGGKVELVLTRGEERSKLTVEAVVGARTEAKFPPLAKPKSWDTGKSDDVAGESKGSASAVVATPASGPDAVTPETPSRYPANDRGAFIAGAKFGALASLDGLDPHMTGAVQVGYVLPFLSRSFGVMVDAGYARPMTGDVVGDPRIEAGGYTWHLTQDQLTVQPSLYYRATVLDLGNLVPYVGAGPRIFLTRSRTDSAEKLPTLLEQNEESMEIGFGVHAGAEYLLGPGAVMAEVLYGRAAIQQRTTGDTALSAVTAWAGYRFML